MMKPRFLAALMALLICTGPWQMGASAQDYKPPPQRSEALDASDGSRWIGRVVPEPECKRFVLERADASEKPVEKYRLADQCVIGGVYGLAVQNGIVVALLEGHPADWLLVLDQPGLKECSRTPVGDPIFSPSKRWVSAMRFEPHFQQSVGYGVRSYDVNTCRHSEGVEFGGLEPTYRLERREEDGPLETRRFLFFPVSSQASTQWLSDETFGFVESVDRKLLVHQVTLSEDGQATDVVNEIPSFPAAKGEARLWSTLLEQHGAQLKLEKLWVEDGVLRVSFGLFDSAERFSASVPLAKP